MTKRAFAFEAGAAFEFETDDFGFVAQRRGVVGAGRAVDRDQFAVERGGQVHQAAVVADHGIGAGEQVDGFGEAGAAAQVGTDLVAQAVDFVGDVAVFLRAEQPDLPAFGGVAAGEFGKMGCRPAFGGAVFGAGAEGEDGALGVELVFGERGLLAGGVDLEMRLAGMAVEVSLAGMGERGVAVNH